MAEPSDTTPKKPNVVEEIVNAGTKAFNPSNDGATRDAGRHEYDQVIQSVDTWTLLHALNALVKPDAVAAWMRPALMQSLTVVPLRPDGVRATLEFVFSVHPSNVGRKPDAEEAQKQGASITHEAVAVATKLLSSVPSGMTPEQWFGGLSSQMFALLDGDAGPDVAKTIAQIVGYGVLGKKSYGAPGTPGWAVFVQPIIEKLNPSLSVKDGNFPITDEDEVIDLTKPRQLVDSANLQAALRRLAILVVSNPSPGLCKRLLKNVILQIWTLASLQVPNEEVKNSISTPARRLLQTYLRLFGKVDSIMPLIRNLTIKGSSVDSEPAWEFTQDSNHGVVAVACKSKSATDLNLSETNVNASKLVGFMTTSCSNEDMSSIFLQLLTRWIQSSSQNKVDIEIVTVEQSSENPMADLMEVTVLQQMMEQAPDKLISHFDQLMNLISQVFKADLKAHLEDDVLSIVLSLFNLVVTAPTFEKSDIKPDELTIVETALNRISQEDRPDVAPTARNLFLLLKYRDEIEDPKDKTTAPSARQVADRKTYDLAMNYITADKENPPPIASEGLNLLSGLIVSNSPILDITAMTVLMSNLLKDSEDYINLRVIKIFTQLANKHPKATIKEILDNYIDGQEKSTTDTRLRFGEALLQVIERLGETFTGDAAQQTGESLLSIAGRRGYRPKTMAKQGREERLRKMKEAKKQAGGAVDDDEDEDMLDDEDLTEEDKLNNDVLAQIVQGWESKRGAEDIRMRTSSLSIFGSAIEANIRGMGPTIVSAGVDLCLNILAMEPELEQGILRRAAIIVILSFVKALDEARQTGKSLGFGLTDQSRADIQRTLEYIAATDNDGLVQEHARDVVESLENWGMASLLPRESASSGLGNLAGLGMNPSVNLPSVANNETIGGRPRIEEIE